MNSSTKLGGFKILKGVVWTSLVLSKDSGNPVVEFFHYLASKQINVPFVTCVNQENAWLLNLAFESDEASKASAVFEKKALNKEAMETSGAAILSIFPHKKSPKITGAVLDIYGREMVNPAAFASSPSAISVVLREETVDRATSCLFEPLRFSAYRTPEDWKLAQKGKETLYKEVVASYQEKRPKVYFIEWQDKQFLLEVMLAGEELSLLGYAFQKFDETGIPLNFLVSTPLETGKDEGFFFCVPTTPGVAYDDMIKRAVPGASTRQIPHVAVFSMNGPHFGDRYGIVSDLFTALDSAQIELLGLSCSIHSVTGALPGDKIHDALEAIQACFDVPSIIKR